MSQPLKENTCNTGQSCWSQTNQHICVCLGTVTTCWVLMLFNSIFLPFLTFQEVNISWLASVSVIPYSPTSPAVIMYTTLNKMATFIPFSVQNAAHNMMQLLYLFSITRVGKRLGESCFLWFEEVAKSDRLNLRVRKKQMNNFQLIRWQLRWQCLPAIRSKKVSLDWDPIKRNLGFPCFWMLTEFMLWNKV